METTETISQEEFKYALEPLLEMLVEKEKTLSTEEWTTLVNSTKERIVSVPEQYLTGISKSSDELKAAIDAIFRERLNYEVVEPVSDVV